MRAKLFIVLGALLAIGWAVPSAGTAHFIVKAASRNFDQVTPLPVRLRLRKDQGLLVTAWIDGKGPYIFAVDTGAGMNLVTQRVVSEAQLTVRSVRPTTIGGLTSATSTASREAVFNQLALGDRSNTFRAKRALVVNNLGPGIDGILDPTDVYSPYGYSIDMQRQRLEALEPQRTESIDRRRGQSVAEGAVVPWMRFGSSVRPFVRLGDGRLALIDTGSSFGLAVNDRDAIVVGRGNRPALGVRDIAGGAINSRRVAPTTISIGDLVLRGVPTDILFGVEDDAPLILGRDALYPFKITFDPQRRLISFATSERN